MRPVFEEFTDARTVLSDIKLRQSYLRGMLDVHKLSKEEKFVEHSDDMIANSHDAWNRKHRPDKAETDVRGRKKKDNKGGGGGDDGSPLQLEGGLHQVTPRGVMLHLHRKDGSDKTTVSVSIHVLRPIHEFYARVSAVRVRLKAADDEVHVITLKRAEIVKNIRSDRQVSLFALCVILGVYRAYSLYNTDSLFTISY